MVSAIHYIDFSSDARHAICGWEPPADYAGTTVYLSSATCPACMAAIQTKIAVIEDEAGERSPHVFVLPESRGPIPWITLDPTLPS